jgi:hypothetical protein
MFMRRLPTLGFVIWAAPLPAMLAACHDGLHSAAGFDGGSGTEVANGDSDLPPPDGEVLAIDMSDSACGEAALLGDSSIAVDEIPREVARIARVGTNFGRLTVIVYSDASADRISGGDAWHDLIPDGSSMDVLPPGSPPVVKFLQDLALVNDVSVLQGPPTCPDQSVSFGTRTYLYVSGNVGGNLECLNNATEAQAALAADCVTLTR